MVSAIAECMKASITSFLAEEGVVAVLAGSGNAVQRLADAMLCWAVVQFF